MIFVKELSFGIEEESIKFIILGIDKFCLIYLPVAFILKILLFKWILVDETLNGIFCYRIFSDENLDGASMSILFNVNERDENLAVIKQKGLRDLLEVLKMNHYKFIELLTVLVFSKVTKKRQICDPEALQFLLIWNISFKEDLFNSRSLF